MAKDVVIRALVQSVDTKRKVNRDGIARKLTKIVLEADAMPKDLIAKLSACDGDQEITFVQAQAELEDAARGDDNQTELPGTRRRRGRDADD